MRFENQMLFDRCMSAIYFIHRSSKEVKITGSSYGIQPAKAIVVYTAESIVISDTWPS
jgi:hypothetical protein